MQALRFNSSEKVHVIINNYDLPAQSKTQSFTRPTYFGETLNPAAMFFSRIFSCQSCLELQKQVNEKQLYFVLIALLVV